MSAGDYVVIEGYQKMGPGMKVIATPESEAHGVTPGPLFDESALETTNSAEAPPAEGDATGSAQ